jgi:biotin operon repressor
VPFQASLLEAAPQPVYQRIARKCLQLQQLGLSLSAIGRRLEVTDKTVAKAIEWLDSLAAER